MSSCGSPAICQYGRIENSTGFCLCNEGFTSFSDFRFQNNSDCDIYFVVIQILFSLSLFIYFFQTMRILLDTFIQVKQRGVQNVFNMKQNLNQIKAFLFLELLFGIIFCSLKVSSPEFVVGTNETTTWIYFLFRLFNFMASLGVTGFFYSLEIKAMGVTGRRVVRLETLYWANVIFGAFGICVWILIIMSYYFQQYGCQLIQTSFYVLIFSIYLNAFRKHLEIKPLLQALDKSTEFSGQSPSDVNTRIKKAKKRFRTIHLLMVHSSIVLGTIMLIVISVPASLHNLSYYEATITLVISISNLSVLGLLLRTNSSTSSSTQDNNNNNNNNKGALLKIASKLQ